MKTIWKTISIIEAIVLAFCAGMSVIGYGVFRAQREETERVKRGYRNYRKGALFPYGAN